MAVTIRIMKVAWWEKIETSKYVVYSDRYLNMFCDVMCGPL